MQRFIVARSRVRAARRTNSPVPSDFVQKDSSKTREGANKTTDAMHVGGLRLSLKALLLGTLGVLFQDPAAVVVDAYRSHAGGCDATEGHGSTAMNGTFAGYTLTATSGRMAPGETVTLTLAAPSGGTGDGDFKGFIVTADDGIFEAPWADNSQAAVECAAGGVGHVSATPKASVEVFITLPSTPKTVNVTAQIVKTKRSIYAITLALDVRVGAVPLSPPTTCLAPSPAPSPSQAPSSTCASSALGYQCSTRINDKVTLHWTVGREATSPSLVGPSLVCV